MPPALTHLALHVRDLDACISFYRDYCGLSIVSERGSGPGRVAWLSEKGRESELVLVLIGGGKAPAQSKHDLGHQGFAVESREEVDHIAERARSAGYLVWEPRQDDYPVGYFCGVKDPDGNIVEFSFGQPLGPGS